MKMLRQIINRESLENSQENVSDKVYLLESCKSTLYNYKQTSAQNISGICPRNVLS